MESLIVLKKIANEAINRIDDFPLPLVTFDDSSPHFEYEYEGIRCVLHKVFRSARSLKPPSIYYTLSTFVGDKQYQKPVQFWVLHPSMDPEVNRKALGKALEKYRDQPTAALGQFDLASESLLVSFLVCSSA